METSEKKQEHKAETSVASKQSDDGKTKGINGFVLILILPQKKRFIVFVKFLPSPSPPTPSPPTLAIVSRDLIIIGLLPSPPPSSPAQFPILPRCPHPCLAPPCCVTLRHHLPPRVIPNPPKNALFDTKNAF